MRLIGAGTRRGAALTDHEVVFTVPNVLTVLRFLGVPLFMWLVLAREQYGYGVLVLAIMAGTDWVDGYVARRFDQMSRLGRVLDPIADRLALTAVAVTLVIAGIAPWWLLAALVIPDAILLALCIVFFRWHPDLPVSILGKVRMAALLLGTPLLLLAKAVGSEPNALQVVAWIILVIGLAGHLIAAVSYYRAIVEKHRREPRPKGPAAEGRPT
ncbi:CDP-alcohol phosphatidyltransferase family protein [Arthrobacter sp. H14-L1]|uniref:CDP-alcohol phosphatidyltransferase family protein n=1 Tax=Arthrobacter sp. H14-L1 TaxID=2996697 RepID=UPI00226DE388|nr:CDP-alcohol phosphatidyltransferase family protein [Arthrobacter sp. H14-L1]MCY0904637.1 CDP-alcohol phosphatidyltransferase family protein [Arthrobacter sp. H14-L1]